MKSFFSPKDEKITEKAFSQSIAISVIGIVLCIVALCSATWAWFSEEVSSTGQTIKTGYCTVTVSVKNGENEVPLKEGTSDTYTFSAGEVYDITITSEGTGRSYCKFLIGENAYYTQQIEPNGTITFTLTFTADTDVKIITCWGMYKDEDRDVYHGKEYKDFQEIEADTGDTE